MVGNSVRVTSRSLSFAHNVTVSTGRRSNRDAGTCADDRRRRERTRPRCIYKATARETIEGQVSLQWAREVLVAPRGTSRGVLQRRSSGSHYVKAPTPLVIFGKNGTDMLKICLKSRQEGLGFKKWEGWKTCGRSRQQRQHGPNGFGLPMRRLVRQDIVVHPTGEDG